MEIKTEGSFGYGGQFFLPNALAIGRDGRLYIVDSGNSRVVRLEPTGRLILVAGDGTSGYGKDGGPATEAQLSLPQGIAVGPDGSSYLADSGNRRR